MERPRYLDEIVEAMQEDKEVTVWMDRLMLLVIQGRGEGPEAADLENKIEGRRRYYDTTPIEIEITHD